MFIVFGVPGAGKTTVLEQIKKELPDYKIVNYGDLMLESALNNKLVRNRDEMRELPNEVQKKLQAEVAEKLSKETGRLILDTHCAIYTPKGYLPGVPFHLLKKLKVDGFVFITAPLNDIIRRINSDTARSRDMLNREELEERLHINKIFLCTYSAFTGAPVAIIENANGKIEEAVEKLKKVLG